MIDTIPEKNLPYHHIYTDKVLICLQFTEHWSYTRTSEKNYSSTKPFNAHSQLINLNCKQINIYMRFNYVF